MKRRETLKSLLVGGIAGTAVVGVGALSCKTDNHVDKKETEEVGSDVYGRTPSEIEHDKKINAQVCYNEHQLTTIAVLCDIILPPSSTAGGANDAKVPEFIEFISKDLASYHELPIKGGLMWLDGESNARFNKEFVLCDNKEQIAIIDDIAYPDPENQKLEMAQGRAFFNKMRDLTLTGYYTTKMGIDDLGYVGNRPNMWDGVPQDVLDKHGLAYDKDWLPKFVDHEKSNDIAEWDDNGNLLT